MDKISTKKCTYFFINGKNTLFTGINGLSTAYSGFGGVVLTSCIHCKGGTVANSVQCQCRGVLKLS